HALCCAPMNTPTRHVTRCLVAGIVALLPIGGTVLGVAYLETTLTESWRGDVGWYFPGLGLLLALLLRRFWPDRRAFAAALLWSLLPSHVGSLAWAVGRVDSHTTVWCLAALLLFVRQCEQQSDQQCGQPGGRAPRWPALLCFALALGSKELAFVVPPLAVALGALTARATATATVATLRARAGFALRQAWPLLVLFVLYLGWRQVALGRLGGYLAGELAPWPMLRGLGEHLANLACPWRWAPGLDRGWTWLAAAPAGLATLWAATRWRAALILAALFAIAAAPMAMFFADSGNVHNLRYLYLPSMLLAALLASRNAAITWLVIATLLWPLVAVRQAQYAADRESAAMHAAILREAEDGAASPMFVAGLPHQNAAGTTVQLHFGVDRMLAPPFADDPARLYALRPLSEVRGVVRLSAADELPFALPEGSTWFFAGADTFGRAPEAAPRPPDLLIEGDADGLLDVSTQRLFAVTAQAQQLFAQRAPTFGLRTPGVKPQGYRVTIFTASGYLSCLCGDYDVDGPTAGSIDLLRFLAQDPTRPALPPAITATVGTAWAGEALTVPTTLDRDTDFPVLIEAGSMQNGQFVPTARARRLLRFRFDRGYAAWVRAVQGKN
ncbi:MAG: hypothetical protein KDC48_17595, partial [Planctomycetes bacterium]|nr:hypothetical protein [Planctomycetota bacterium]